MPLNGAIAGTAKCRRRCTEFALTKTSRTASLWTCYAIHKKKGVIERSTSFTRRGLSKIPRNDAKDSENRSLQRHLSRHVVSRQGIDASRDDRRGQGLWL